ncbi:MAG: thioredoxin family protein [bacterium]|nr:thioredoxin family protein [bacterium]
MKHLEKETDFENLIKKDLVLVDFYAEWCGPCKLMSQELELLDQENKELEIIKIDVDKFPELASKNSIMVVPTLKVYKKGQVVNKYSGYLTKDEIKDLLI